MPHTDISLSGLIGKLPPKPQAAALLMRLDRPIGVWLLALPSLWGIAIADPARIDLFLLFAFGAIIMRGAGCIINDLWDQDLDAAVARTRARPLVTGAITRREALVLLAILLAMGLAILLTLSPLAIGLGFLSMVFVVAYPLMKRITWWPQLFLGITFNFGILIGYAAVTGTLTWPTLLLYAGAVFWTLGYDTIYAHQDKDDDELIGIKSTARLFAEHSKIWVSGFYAVATIIFCIATESFLPLIVSAHFAWQIWRWDFGNPVSSLRIFKSNRDAGLIILFIIICIAVLEDKSMLSTVVIPAQG
jgi:4-hydroxybenzoate polyprenyltransferase